MFLRFRGNYVCRCARSILDHMKIKYTEIYIGDEVIAGSRGKPMCRLLVNGITITIILYYSDKLTRLTVL
jgi:hypothetical protein